MRYAALFLLFCLTATSFSQAPKSWTWWTPPKRITKGDRLGYSPKQILAMGSKSWYRRANRTHSETLNHVDWPVIVNGYCWAQRNNELLRQESPQRRRQLRAIRNELFYFGMACIAVEDSLAGGGTYANHYPMTLYVHNEKRLADLLRTSGQAQVRPNIERELYTRIVRMQTLDLSPPSQLGVVGNVSLPHVHRYGKYVAHHYHNLRRLMTKLDKRQKDLVLDAMDEWLIDYINIRGANEVLQRHATSN